MFEDPFAIIGRNLQNDELFLKNWAAIDAENRGIGSHYYGTAYQDDDGTKLIMFDWKAQRDRYEEDLCAGNETCWLRRIENGL